MKAPLFLTLAVLAAALPLAARGQSVPDSLSGEADGDFRDLGITRLVDAVDALRDPAAAPLLPPVRPGAPDASLCAPDSLLFAEQDPLAPGDPWGPALLPAAAEVPGPPAREFLPAGPGSPGISPGPVIEVTRPESSTGSVIPASQPVLAGATPVPAEQVPEPSAILLVIGAAAWILLRRKQ
jgi:hypothetical protein